MTKQETLPSKPLNPKTTIRDHMKKHPSMSPDNIALQESWCKCRSKAISDGARSAAGKCFCLLYDMHISLGNVLVIGPQHGFELIEWKLLTQSQNADSAVIGLEPVPLFAQDCRDLGFPVLEKSAESLRAEDLPTENGPFNIYCRHTAEHFVDRDLAFQNMLSLDPEWIYLEVPVEPEVPRDKAHLSSFKSHKEASGCLDGLVWSKMSHSTFFGLFCPAKS